MDVPALPPPRAHSPRAPEEVGPTRARFRALYDEHFAFVWRATLRLGVPSSEAEDAVQEVFLVAFRRWSSFAGRSTLRTWLFAIARRVASHDRRSRFRHARRTEAFGACVPTAHDGEAVVEARDARVQLDGFLAALDPPKREVFILADLEGFTGREVAQTLGIKPNTAWSRLKAARAEFTRTFGAGVRKQNVLIDATPSPPARASARVWAVMLPQLPWGAKAAAGGSAGVATLKAWLLGANIKVFGATVVAGVGTVAAVSVVVPEAPAASEPSERRARAKGKKKPARTKPSSARTAAPARAKPRPPDPVAPAALVPIQRPAAMVTAPAPVSRVRASRRAEKAGADPPTRSKLRDPLVPNTDGLPEAEVELMKRAKGALAQGQPRRVLLLVEEHARRFPQSKLSTLRRVLRIEALCKANKRPQGIGEASALLKAHRSKRLVRRLQKACGLGPHKRPKPPAPKVALAE